MGKYVSGSATAENTTEYSVTLMGSTVVSRTPIARIVDRSSTRWNRVAFFGGTNLPHCHPKNCAMLYPTDSPVSHAAPNVAAKKPINATARPSFPSATATGSPTCAKESTCTPRGNNTSAAVAAIAIDNRPPSGKPTNTLARIVGMSFVPQCSSTPPDEKKNTSYGVI